MGYAKHLMPSLAEKLNDFLKGDDYQTKLKLYEEIALARTLLVEDLKILNALHIAKAQGKAEATDELLMLAANHIRKATEHVADLCERMARIEKSFSDRIGVQQLGFFVEQLTRVIYTRLGPENEEIAKQLAEDLQHRVKLPADPRFDPNIEVEVTYE